MSYIKNELSSCDCGQTFPLLSSLKHHQQEQHFVPKFNLDFYESFDPPKNFGCVQCDQKFKRKHHLSRHIKSAHSEKVFHCLQCVKTYGRQDALSHHIDSEHTVTGYNCDQCDQEFSRKDALS